MLHCTRCLFWPLSEGQDGKKMPYLFSADAGTGLHVLPLVRFICHSHLIGSVLFYERKKYISWECHLNQQLGTYQAG